MKKELLLAILIGLTVGLVIVYGVYRARVILTPKGQRNMIEASPTPEPSAEVLSKLVVHSPLDESIQETPNVTIAGTTNHNDFVVILVNDQDFVTTADSSGNFSISAQLEVGSNVIQVISIDEDNQSTTQELTVIYTTKPLLETASASAALTNVKN